MKVCNLNQDFYKVIQEDRIPQHHIFMTNPPYSSDHVPRCLEFCRKSMKPCLLLLPNWVAKKPYFFEMFQQRMEDIFFIAPVQRYTYIMPPDLVPESRKPAWVGEDGKTSPFQSSWYVIVPPELGPAKIYDRLESDMKKTGPFDCVLARKLQAVKWKLKKVGSREMPKPMDHWSRAASLMSRDMQRKSGRKLPSIGGWLLLLQSLFANVGAGCEYLKNLRPIRQESKVPVQPPSFQSDGFSEQVTELLELITPSEASERVAKELAAYTESIIQEMLPGALVEGFANADILRGTAFGVAVPEIDLVVNADPECLERQLQGRLAKGGVHKTRMDARKMQKSAIRACTDLLVAAGGFKFRRSAFRCEEPKVTLMGPSTMSVSGQGIPVDFSVNCATPGCHAALVSACGGMDARSRGLILLVRRWSKDRGVCHVARGHLSPYGWTLLAIFYLQALS
ncbi:papd4-b [Symbiodinium natans]|uniref:Papd4-b protein n=1 Tax=Symbiodinium natans TaxID=878477 RepID=A0A812GGY1_9DINO|nr:papd4-b [Symbiodinium natans]